MSVNYSFGMAVLFFCVFLFGSCNDRDKEDDLFDPSVSSILVEGEGVQTSIRFSHGDWNIIGIVNKNGNVNIHGNVLSPDGTMLQENTLLKLDGLGKLESLWRDKGFIITREEPTLLLINVTENSTGKDFDFTIIIQTGEDLKKVSVMQKKSEGYRFDKIEYFIKEGDGDSLFVSKKSSLKFITTSNPMEIGISPLLGLKKRSVFESPDKGAFIWLQEDSVMVQVPGFIYNDNVRYAANEKHLYTNLLTEIPCPFDNPGAKILVPAGKSEIVTEIEYRQRRVSYVLTLVNNRTGEKKMIEGKWIEIAPNGNYALRVEPCN